MMLIIGYGNPLRGDDALGQTATAHLGRLFRSDDDVDVDFVQQLTPELAERLAGYETVVLVDARRGTLPGKILIEEVEPNSAPASHPFSHYVTPAELLLLARGLYGATPRIFVASITGASFEVGAPLSDPVSGALTLLYEQIAALVQAGRSGRAAN